jgi:outer membrane protein
MKKFIYTVVALFMGLTGVLGQSDSLWSLDQCIEHAIQFNLDVKRQELALQSTGQDHRQSKLDLLPNLNGMIEHQLGTGRVLDRGTYEWKNANVSQGDLGLQSDLTLFDGLQGFNSMKMNKANYQMNMKDLEAMVNNITIQVMTGYLDLLRNRELVAVAEQKVGVTQKQVARMERLVEVGNESKGKLLEVNAQLSAEKLAYTRAVNTVEISKLTLMHVMNTTDSKGFDIETPDLPDPSTLMIPERDSVFMYALANLPEIKSRGFGIEAQERYLAMVRGQRSPTLYARGFLRTNYSDGLSNPIDPTEGYPINQQMTDNQYKQVSMGINIPFFNRWQVQTNINKAKLDLQDAEYQYDNAVLVLEQTLQQYHAEAVAASDNYSSALEAVANSDEAFRFAEERFKVGTGTALEMQEARNQLYESTSQMISSKFVLIFYTKILDFYMGKGIEL